MPSGIHQFELNTPIEQVWNFVSDMNKWAPLVTGYMDHTIVNERQSTWKFRGDLGVVRKIVHLQIDIKEWTEPRKITFDLTGLNENFTGEGYFESKVTSGKGEGAQITGFLNITAKGIMGPMINSILKSFVPRTTEELTIAIATEIKKVETVTI